MPIMIPVKHFVLCLFLALLAIAGSLKIEEETFQDASPDLKARVNSNAYLQNLIQKTTDATVRFNNDTVSCFGGGGPISVACELKLQNDGQGVETAYNDTVTEAEKYPITCKQVQRICALIRQLMQAEEELEATYYKYQKTIDASGFQGAYCETIEDARSETSKLLKTLYSQCQAKCLKKLEFVYGGRPPNPLPSTCPGETDPG